jgi:GDPmannose 4,6-dehydratase
MLSIARPSEIYNLGAQSQVAVSFETPEYTADSSGMGTLRLLEAMRTTDLSQNCKFYQASTSELFGGLSNEAYSEKSEFRPRSPYAVSKLFAYWTTVNYREAYNIWAVNGILFNHESPRRGETFVTRKITRGLSRIKHGLQERLVLGNLDAERDWGHAKDFVDAMWLMMQQEKPEDYVIATGEKHSVREFVNYTAAALEMKINWLGKGNDEHGVNDLGKTIISLDSGYERPTEVNQLLGDSSLARTKLGWSPRFKFEDLVLEMAEADEQLAIIEKSRR